MDMLKYKTGQFQGVKLLSEPFTVKDVSTKIQEFQRPTRGTGQSGQGSPKADEDYKYQFSKSKLGLAVIMNNTYSDSKMQARKDSPKDVEKLCETFSEVYNFDVLVGEDLKRDEMKQFLQEVAKAEYLKDADCFACVVMAHGMSKKIDSQYTDVLYGNDTEEMNTKDLLDCFQDSECPKLQNKPKLFFVQSCRGNSVDLGASRSASPGQGDDDDKDLSESDFGFPFGHFLSYNDVMIMYATPPGYTSLRDVYTGPPFIEKLCSVLSEETSPTPSLLLLLTRVQNEVANCPPVEFSKNDVDVECKQIPIVDFKFTKDVYLPKKV